MTLLRQFSAYLPLILSLSSSSPFWQGEDTGLSSYRLTIFDNLPRTGLPPRFESWAEYERSAQVLIDLGEIEVRHHPRRHGVSKYGFSRLYKGLLDLITVRRW